MERIKSQLGLYRLMSATEPHERSIPRESERERAAGAERTEGGRDLVRVILEGVDVAGVVAADPARRKGGECTVRASGGGQGWTDWLILLLTEALCFSTRSGS